MKAITIVAERKVELCEQPIPEPRPNEVLMKIHTSMLCTVEQRVFTRVMSNPLPFVGGHEFAGVIAAAGSQVDAKAFPVGTRCSASLVTVCGVCESCRRGHSSLCVHKLGGHYTPGRNGLAEYLVVDARNVYLFGDNVPFERIAFTEPLSCVVSAHDKFPVGFGDEVGIQGGGLMGIMHGRLAKMRGARVTICEPDATRRKKVLELGVCDVVVDPVGADPAELARKATGKRGFDVVINTTAIPATVEPSIAMCTPGGTFLMYGKVFPDPRVTIDINYVQDRSLRIAGTMGGDIHSFHRASKLLASGCLSPEEMGLYAGSYSKEEAQAAYERAITPGTFRVGITF